MYDRAKREFETLEIGANETVSEYFAQNPITNPNSEHIDVNHNFLLELVPQRDIKVVRAPSEFQHADILVKALAFDLFAFHRKFLLNLM